MNKEIELEISLLKKERSTNRARASSLLTYFLLILFLL